MVDIPLGCRYKADKPDSGGYNYCDQGESGFFVVSLLLVAGLCRA